MSVKKEKNKRKHESEENVESKKAPGAKHKLNKESDNSVTNNNKSDDENDENEETEENYSIPNKKKTVFSAKSFRKSLSNTKTCLDSIKEFVNLCNQKESSTDYCRQYLEVGGNLMEVLKALENTDKQNLPTVTPIFEAANLILLKIQAIVPNQKNTAEEACRYILNNYLLSIQAMLSPASTPRQKRIVLKLLTSMVTLSQLLAKDILLNVNFQNHLEILVKPADGNEFNSVRISFIYFILSFIIDGNTSIIRHLLDKKHVIHSIFPDLIYDDHKIVNLVLSSLRAHIVENPSITKTLKMHIFNTNTLKHIVNLYNWKGRKFWKLKVRKKVTTLPEDIIDANEKEIVSKSVHEFLILLCTSGKHGLIFRDKTLGLTAQNTNKLILTVLEALEKPWDNKYASELVVKIAGACPDLYSYIISMVENYLEPRASRRWLNVVKFVKGVLQVLTPDSIMADLKLLTPKQILTVIQKFCIPNIIIKSLSQSKFMSHGDPYIREVSIDLFITILTNLDSYVQAVQKEGILNDPKLIRSLYESLLKILPNLDALATTWSMLENKSIYLDSALIFEEYLNTFNIKIGILDMLIYYHRIFPETLDNLPNKFSPEQILLDVKNFDTILKNKIIQKASQLFMLVDSTTFLPQNQHFSGYLDILLSNKDLDSIKILKDILKNTGIFENNLNEIDIWLKSDLLNFESVKNLFILSLKYTCDNLESLTDEIAKLKSSLDVEYSKKAEIDAIFNLLESENLSVQKVRHTIASPLIISFLKLYTNGTQELEENDWKYFENVLVNIFHAQTLPELLIALISRYKLKSKYCKRVLSYINSWNGENPIPLNISGDDYVLMNKISEILLLKSNEDIRNIFKMDDSESFSLTISDVEYTISIKWREKFDINLFHMILFYLTQLSNKQILTAEQVDIFERLLIVVFEIIHSKENLFELLTLIYNNPTIVKKFVPFYRKKHHSEKFITELILKLTRYFQNHKSCSNLQSLIEPFRSKLITRIQFGIKHFHKHLNTSDIQNLMSLIETFELDMTDCFLVISELILLPTEAFISNEQTLSVFGHILSYCLEKLSQSYETVFQIVFSSEQLISLQKHFINFNKNFTNINIDELTKKFLIFITKFPHFVSEITSSFFKSFITKSPTTKSDVKLIVYLSQTEPKFLKYIDKNFESLLQNKELIFPLISVLDNSPNFEKYSELIFKQYEPLILKAIEKPHKIGQIVRENSRVIRKLIECSMSVEECQKIAQKIYKYETAEEFHLSFIETIYNKCIKINSDSILISNYLQTLINLTKIFFKHGNLDKINMIFKKIQQFLKPHSSSIQNLKIYENSSWSMFVKLCLKYGIKKPNTDDEDQSYSNILQTLRILYQFFCKKSANDQTTNEIAMTYEMIQSHSEYLNVMLNNNSRTKTEILKLLLILSKTNEKMLSEKSVPILLGAYTATTNLNDQLILSILYLYEKSNINLDHLKPFVWGDFAISHYSVRQNIKDSLWRQLTMATVLDLLKYDVVVNTIRNFDVRRSFLLLEQNDYLLDIDKLTNENIRFNDKLVESAKGEYSTRSHIADTFTGDTYDLNFLLPLFSYLLSSNSVVKCYKFVQSGAFSLTLIALASNCTLVRQAAYNVLARFYFHLESNTSTKERKIWLEFINRIRLGILKLCDDNHCDNEHLARVKISSISATFLARAALIMTHPLNPLYIPINNFVFVKAAIDFTIVPELLEMFHNSDVDYQIYRHWILQIIRDGLKTATDIQVMWKSVAFKMFMDFYSSHSLCDTETSLFILQIIEVAVTVRKGMKFLIFERGVLSWLHGIVTGLDRSNTKQIEILLKICNNLYSSISKFEHNKSGYLLQLLSLLLKIANLLSSNTSSTSYLLFTKLLTNVAKDNYQRITREQMLKIITLCTGLIGVNDCKCILNFGCKYVPVNTMDENNTLDEKVLIGYYLRMLTIEWTKNCNDLIKEGDSS